MELEHMWKGANLFIHFTSFHTLGVDILQYGGFNFHLLDMKGVLNLIGALVQYLHAMAIYLKKI